MRNIENNKLEVGTISLSDLFTNEMSIPDFQRPFEWTERLVAKLIKDLENHFYKDEKYNNENQFYLGSILLYEKDNKLNVIDGQQRLTTFLILDYVVRKEDSWLQQGANFTYYNSSSVENIKIIMSYISQLVAKGEIKFSKSDYTNIIGKIILNVVIAGSEDRAFQFFDSLNSKGKKLDTINVLKSFHLRALEGNSNLQLQMASNFDVINSKVESYSFKQFKIFSLNQFVSILWLRIYRWTKGNFNDILKEDLEDYFQENSVSYSSLKKNQLKLFPGIRNMNNNVVTMENEATIYHSEHKILNINNCIYEFNPLLPIQKGLGFFISIESLANYYNDLFVKQKISKLIKINNLVKQCFNAYFLHLYYMSVLSYYVKFGEEKIEQFAFEIEQILGNKFLSLESVRERSPIVLLRDEFNVLREIFLNVDIEMLLHELRQFKSKSKVLVISVGKKENKDFVTIISQNGNKDSPIHTSRPNYIKNALATYCVNCNDLTHYVQLSKDNILL